jgi:hypothetical protein
MQKEDVLRVGSQEKLVSKNIISFLISMFLALCGINGAYGQAADPDGYLQWDAATAIRIGEQMRQKGKVGSAFTMRGINTQRAINYKMRATLMSSEMIRAAARIQQITNRLSDDETKALVAEAESAGDLVVMIEIDPNEGSGVIPLDWRVFLQANGTGPGIGGAVAGIKSPQLRNVKALNGVFRRKYDYDLFFVVFPLTDGEGVPLISPDALGLEVVVGIYNKEGRVSWRTPESIRAKIKTFSEQRSKEVTK